MKTTNVFMGWDPREKQAYHVARHSILSRSNDSTRVIPIQLELLKELGIMDRPIERREGGMWCPISQAPMATEFAISRFSVPLMQRSGWAVFVDCDIICKSDISELFALADDNYAVMVVKHNHVESGRDKIKCWLECGCERWVCREVQNGSAMRCETHSPPDDHKLFRVVRIGEALKMDGQVQTYYARKNWSSVILWNCSHPSNKLLTSMFLNTWPGRDLHAFGWLKDDEIGELPAKWNQLVGVDELHEPYTGIIHYTLGGPWFKDWKGGPADKEWLAESDDESEDLGLRNGAYSAKT